MKLKNIIVYFFFFSFITLTDGFIKNTLIITPQGLLPIETLFSNDLVTSKLQIGQQNYPIIHTQNFISNSYVNIKLSDLTLCAAPNQKFYSTTRKKWIKAKNLQSSEHLLCMDAPTIVIDHIELINEPKKMYSLTIQTNHCYCVTSRKIIVHNFDPVSMTTGTAILACVCPFITPILITVQTTIGTIMAGIGIYAVYKSHKKTKLSTQIQEETKNNNSLFPSPKKPDDDEDENEHPHGIYENAKYHHKNSTGNKSPSPEKGQRCLDYSLPYINNQRIAIEGNNFIALKQTLPRKFHGHVIQWKEIPGNIRKILQLKGYVTKAGKILKQITEKTLP